MTVPTASTIARSSEEETAPSYRTSRRVETDFTWNASAAEGLAKPFVADGSTLTIQKAAPNSGCHAVKGTTTRSASTPTASLLTITAGRVFRISASMLGSKETCQTSPYSSGSSPTNSDHSTVSTSVA
jgi:hypothetical protein